VHKSPFFRDYGVDTAQVREASSLLAGKPAYWGTIILITVPWYDMLAQTTRVLVFSTVYFR
jgi:hypothetical protein